MFLSRNRAGRSVLKFRPVTSLHHRIPCLRLLAFTADVQVVKPVGPEAAPPRSEVKETKGEAWEKLPPKGWMLTSVLFLAEQMQSWAGARSSCAVRQPLFCRQAGVAFLPGGLSYPSDVRKGDV